MSRYPLLIAVSVLVLIVLIAVPAGSAARLCAGPVSRSRVQRFADRQRLLITPGNGNLVIRYLATTRRWRGFGLAIGLVGAAIWTAAQAWSQHHQLRVSVNLIAALAGWFVGAVVAEFRIASSAPGERRTASLTPRLLRRQLRPVARTLPIVLLLLAVGLTVALLVAMAAGRPVSRPDLLLDAVGATVAIGLPALVGRHILNRPKPLGHSDDVTAADDAIRDRSLHVLAGCAVALSAYPTASLGVDLALAVDPDRTWIVVWIAVLQMFVLLVGWLIAIWSRPAVVLDHDVAGPVVLAR